MRSGRKWDHGIISSPYQFVIAGRLEQADGGRSASRRSYCPSKSRGGRDAGPTGREEKVQSPSIKQGHAQNTHNARTDQASAVDMGPELRAVVEAPRPT